MQADQHSTILSPRWIEWISSYPEHYIVKSIQVHKDLLQIYQAYVGASKINSLWRE